MDVLVERVALGDEVTIEGVFSMVPNPDKRWWQFWKPALVKSQLLQRYKVTKVVSSA